jgi:hypothetical protein
VTENEEGEYATLLVESLTPEFALPAGSVTPPLASLGNNVPFPAAVAATLKV